MWVRGRPTLSRLGVYFEIIPYLVKIGTPTFRRKVLDLWPEEGVKKVVQIVDTMEKQATAVYDARKKEVFEDDANANETQKKGKNILSTLRESLGHLLLLFTELPCSQSE